MPLQAATPLFIAPLVPRRGEKDGNTGRVNKLGDFKLAAATAREAGYVYAYVYMHALVLDLVPALNP